MDNDIALIKLKESLDLHPYIQLACIPVENDIPNENQYLAYNNTGLTLGFSVFSSIHGGSLFLADFPLVVFNLSNCSGLHPNTSYDSQLFCAGFASFSVVDYYYFLILKIIYIYF